MPDRNRRTSSGRESDIYTDGVLAVVAPVLAGDYNDNGVVDAADYVVWRKNPDAFGGDTGYDTWRTNFGRTAGNGVALPSRESPMMAVPEPSMFVLLMLASAGLCLRVRQRVNVLAKEYF